MVRNIVGAVVYVGAGKHPAPWLGTLLAARDRRLAPPTFAASGLYLVDVAYEREWGLPQSSDDPLALPMLVEP